MDVSIWQTTQGHQIPWPKIYLSVHFKAEKSITYQSEGKGIIKHISIAPWEEWPQEGFWAPRTWLESLPTRQFGAFDHHHWSVSLSSMSGMLVIMPWRRNPERSEEESSRLGPANQIKWHLSKQQFVWKSKRKPNIGPVSAHPNDSASTSHRSASVHT